MIKFQKNTPFEPEFKRDLEILVKKYFREADDSLNLIDYVMYWSKFSDWEERVRKFLDDIALAAFNYYQTNCPDKDYYVVDEKPKVMLEINRKRDEDTDARFSLMWIYHLAGEKCSYAIETRQEPLWTLLTETNTCYTNWNRLIPDYEGFFSTRKPLPGTKFDDFKVERIPGMDNPNLEGLDAEIIRENEPVNPNTDILTGKRLDTSSVKLAPGAKQAPKFDGKYEDWKPERKVYEPELKIVREKVKEKFGEDYEPVDWSERNKQQEEEYGIHREEHNGDFVKAYERRSYSPEFQKENRRELEESYSMSGPKSCKEVVNNRQFATDANGKTYEAFNPYNPEHFAQAEKEFKAHTNPYDRDYQKKMNEELSESYKTNKEINVDFETVKHHYNQTHPIYYQEKEQRDDAKNYSTFDIFDKICKATDYRFEGFRTECIKQYPNNALSFSNEFTTYNDDDGEQKFKYTLSAYITDSDETRKRTVASVTTIVSLKNIREDNEESQ